MNTWDALLYEHRGLRLRNCQRCASYKNMIKVIDDRYLTYDYRASICFKCLPVLTDTAWEELTTRGDRGGPL